MGNPVTTNLAKDVAAYFQELQGRNLSSELAEQLTRDYQQARIAALYGSPAGQVIRLLPAPVSVQIDGKTIAEITWPDVTQSVSSSAET